VRVVPIQSGGGQERGIRSGTVPTPLVVGLGAACQLAQQELEVTALVELCNDKGASHFACNMAVTV
jgi:cysteine sulfinate desulfinase/cysteine desulfurase-like protein